MRVRYWVSSDKNWFYFIYLNPVLILTGSVLSITKAPYFFILIDMLFIFFVSYFYDNIDYRCIKYMNWTSQDKWERKLSETH